MFEYHPLVEETSELRQLAKDHLGEEDFLEITPGYSFYVTLKGDVRPLGFATSCISFIWDATPKIQRLVNPHLEGCSKKIGWLCNSVVHPAWQRRGIGRKFYELRLAELDKEVGYVLISAWVPPGTERANVAGLAERFGFKLLGVVPEFWAGCGCPSCGDACTCGAAVYLRRKPRR